MKTSNMNSQMSYRNLVNKFHRKVDKFLLRRIIRRLILKFCFSLGVSKLPYAPEYLQIDITGFCNLDCPMCPQSVRGQIKEKGTMDFSLYKKIVDSAEEFGIFTVLLVLTGEPFLHRNIFDMISYAKAKGLKASTSTNCTLLTPSISKRIIESGLDEIILSFDTVKRELYEEYRRGARFDTVFSNVINFLELRNKMKRKKPFVVMVNLQAYDSDKPRPKIESDFFKIFSKYDVWIMPKYFSNWSGIMKNDRDLSYSERGIGRESVYSLCETIYHRLVVSWDAKVLSCCNDFTRSQIVGDLSKQSVKEVWNSQDFINLRRKLSKREYQEFPLCKNCGVLRKRI